MKKILVLVYSILIISCSENEDTVTEDGSCFSTGERTTNGLWSQHGQKIFPDLAWLLKTFRNMLMK